MPGLDPFQKVESKFKVKNCFEHCISSSSSVESSPRSIKSTIVPPKAEHEDPETDGEFPHRVIFPFLRSVSDQDTTTTTNDVTQDDIHESKVEENEAYIHSTKTRTKPKRRMSIEFESTIQELKKPIQSEERKEDMSKSTGSVRMPVAGSLSLIDTSKSNSSSLKPSISFPRYPSDYKPPSIPKPSQTYINDGDNSDHSCVRPRSILRRNSCSSQCSNKSSSSLLDEKDNVIGARFKKSILGDFDPLKKYLKEIAGPDSMTTKSSSTPLLKDDVQQMPPRRKSTGILGRKIRFDPQVWVHEYKRILVEKEQMWWTQSEMEKFKYQAVERIRSRHNTFTGSGTGRMVYTPMKSKPRAFYNHPALGFEEEEDYAVEHKELLNDADTELKTILIIDPQEIFLRLLSKSLTVMLPNVEITTARTSEEAFFYIEKNRSLHPISKGGAVHGFDMILTEERLHGIAHSHLKRDAKDRQQSSESSNESKSPKNKPILSGSDFFEFLSYQETEIKKTITTSSNEEIRYSILVGISAFHDEDGASMINSGASMVWGKPPPPMNDDLKLELIKTIKKKRERTNS